MSFSTDLTPGKQDVWFLPLGGTGEIGMNMNLYGHNGQWLMVDCGVMFDKSKPQANGGSTVVSADPHFIAARRQRLVGLVITHAHEDHVGAVPYLWKQLKCPVYTTPFTAQILRRKLYEHDLIECVSIIEVDPEREQQIGHFNVRWLSITHSLPEPYALHIRAGNTEILHTADWKIDPRPVISPAFDPQPFQQLASRKITAMVCDSTNANVPGHSTSEGECYDGLLSLIQKAEGRVVVGCFGSNVARLMTLHQVAQRTGRYMGLLGRSLKNMVSAARSTGHWPREMALADSHHLGYLPRREVLAVATGSQGEPMAALSRLAMGTLRDFELEAGDTVIFSSKVIPGNEKEVNRLVAQLRERGAEVIEAHDSPVPIHASGHPCQDELKKLYEWVKPRVAVPVHGEAVHINAHAQVAAGVGVPSQLRGENGDLYKLAPHVGINRKAVKVGRMTHDRN